LRPILHPHRVTAMASHFDPRLEWEIALAAPFSLRRAMARVDLVVVLPREMEKGTDSRQILVAGFSAAHFWLATGPVYFAASDFLLFLADSVPAIAADSAAAGPVSVVDPAV